MYKSLYSGDEIDLAVSRQLGGTHGESAIPGCHEIGSVSANPQNLFEVIIPGKYTILFYYDMDSSGNPIYIPFEGESPIFMQVTHEGDHHYQRIYIGASLYYRDLASGIYDWKIIDMGVQATEVIDNLTSTNIKAALSANMGRELKGLIDGLQIGNLNLANNTGLRRGTEGWNISSGITRDIDVLYEERPVFKIDGTNLPSSADFLATTSLAAYDAPTSLFTLYTASVWVKPVSDGETATVFVQISFVDDTHATVTDGKKYECTVPANRWTRISVTYQSFLAITAYAKIYFGVTNNSSAYFASPKLENGTYATQWMPSYYDMWSEFDNANFINEIFTDIDEIKDHQGIIYNGEEGKFINEYLAVGGGGGFVQSESPPDNLEVLWFNLSDNDGKFYRWDFKDKQKPRWKKAIPPFYAAQNNPPADIERGWLDDNEEDDIHPAVLCYYDAKRGVWRPVGSAPGKCWVYQENPPKDTNLIWIQKPTMVGKFFVDGAWTPIHAVWGKNISET